MNGIRKAVWAVYAALFGIAGVALLLQSRDPESLAFRIREEWVDLVTPGFLRISGLLLLAAAALPLLLKILELKRSRYVAFENPRGEVAIRLDTVEEFIRRVAAGFPEVAEVTTDIIPHRRLGAEILLGLVIQDGANIPSLTDGMQREIESQMNELLGIENIYRVQINILNIKPGGEE